MIWPLDARPDGESAGHRTAPGGDSLRKVAESFEFEPDFSSWDGKLQARDVVKLERKLFEGLAAALREGAPKNWWTVERIQRKWIELVKSAGRELGDQDGFVRMVERGSA